MNRVIWIKAKCHNYYDFIKKIQYLNIKILDIKYHDNIIYLKIYDIDYDKLNKYLISYKFIIEKNTGLYTILDIIKRNYIILISFLISTVLFIYLTNSIFKINIIHENKEIRELLKSELDDYGIKILSIKKSYKRLNEIRQEILDKYPDKLDWMEFDIDGLILNVRVEERIITNTNKNDKKCNIVAAKNGVINSILVHNGEAKVNINDYVREGDLLISGQIFLNEEEKRRVCASGEVYATTWYKVNVSIPFNYDIYEKTGKKKYNLVWESDNNKKNILKKRFDTYDSSYTKILDLLKYRVYLEKEEETKKITKTYSLEEALNEGINKGISSLEKNLSKNDKIIEKKVLKKSINNSTMDIEVFIVVKELISKEIEIIE